MQFTRKLDPVAAIRRAMKLVLPSTAKLPQMVEEAIDIAACPKGSELCLQGGPADNPILVLP